MGAGQLRVAHPAPRHKLASAFCALVADHCKALGVLHALPRTRHCISKPTAVNKSFFSFHSRAQRYQPCLGCTDLKCVDCMARASHRPGATHPPRPAFYVGRRASDRQCRHFCLHAHSHSVYTSSALAGWAAWSRQCSNSLTLDGLLELAVLCTQLAVPGIRILPCLRALLRAPTRCDHVWQPVTSPACRCKSVQ